MSIPIISSPLLSLTYKSVYKIAFSLMALTYPLMAQADNSTQTVGVSEVSPTEDLMREHGVLGRVLLVYEEIVARLDSGKTFDPILLKNAAQIIQTFIEDYHEKEEENYIFPRFEEKGVMLDLVKTLREQHQQGRVLTNQILEQASHLDLKNTAQGQLVKNLIREFIDMYRPHQYREDTVLFPAFKNLISPEEYHELGETFEKGEHELFGENGFEQFVNQVADIEKALGIYNLDQFTPNTK